MAHLFKRGRRYYLKYYVGGRQKEKSLGTDSAQVAKEKQRRFESALACGDGSPLPTRTPIPDVLGAYVEHIRSVKTPKSAQTEVYYLREAFGPVCEGLRITSRSPSLKTRKRAPKSVVIDGRKRMPVIEAGSFEEVTTGRIVAFIDFKVRDQGLSPKTANHYRSIIRRVFNWAAQTERVRLPNNVNPAAKARPYQERASDIRFLTLEQVEAQLDALRSAPRLAAMVAVLIYAGLRREELLWLTCADVDTRCRSAGSGKHGVIRVRAKTLGDRAWQPKTKRNRVVPISRKLREYLDRYTPPASDDRRYFPSPGGFRGWWDPDNFSADLRVAKRAAGLPWGCLDYRHTFGSQLAHKGVSLYKIATLMGNSPEICRRHYAALLPEALTEEVEFG